MQKTDKPVYVSVAAAARLLQFRVVHSFEKWLVQMRIEPDAFTENADSGKRIRLLLKSRLTELRALLTKHPGDMLEPKTPQPEDEDEDEDSSGRAIHRYEVNHVAGFETAEINERIDQRLASIVERRKQSRRRNRR